MMFQTLCGSPSRIRDLSVTAGQADYTLRVTWNQPAELNGNPNDIQYRVS